MGAGASVSNSSLFCECTEGPEDELAEGFIDRDEICVPDDIVEHIFRKLKAVFDQEADILRETYPKIQPDLLFERLFSSHFIFESNDDGELNMRCSWITPVQPFTQNTDADDVPDNDDEGENRHFDRNLSRHQSVTISIAKKHDGELKYNPKVLKILGEIALAPPKAAKFLGPERSADLIAKQLESEVLERLNAELELQQDAELIVKMDSPKPDQGLTKPPSLKALLLLSDEALDSEVRKMVAARVSAGKKLIAVTGESVVAGRTAHKILGDEMTPAQRALLLEAERREHARAEEESRRALREILEREHPDPDEVEQMLEPHRHAPIRPKAMELMGDEELEELAKSLVPLGLRSQKLAELTGESVVAGRKVHQWLGSGMTNEQIQAMHDADNLMAEEQEQVMREQIKVLLNSGVTAEQIRLRQFEIYGVQDKALKIMGSEELVAEALKLVPRGVKSNKLAELTGESAMAGKNIFKRMGSGMTEEQVRAALKAETEEKRHAERMAKDELDDVLHLDMTCKSVDDMNVSWDTADAKKLKKALALAGDERLEEKSKRIIPKNVKNEKLAMMTGEAQMAGHKVKQIFGEC